jgi:hypothetical protein
MRRSALRRQSGKGGVKSFQRVDIFDREIGPQGNARAAVEYASKRIQTFDAFGPLSKETWVGLLFSEYKQ